MFGRARSSGHDAALFSVLPIPYMSARRPGYQTARFLSTSASETQSYHTQELLTLKAARLIKGKNPHSMVEVKDLQSGDVTAVAVRPVE